MQPPELANSPQPDYSELLRQVWALLRAIAREVM
jgi:hypothetical protein